MLLLIPPSPSNVNSIQCVENVITVNDKNVPKDKSTNNVVNESNSNEFNFNIQLSNLTNAFKFNAKTNAKSNDESIETDFKTVKSKRKMRNSIDNSNSNGDRPGLKIAKHAATRQSLDLPTQNRYSNLNETVLTGKNTLSDNTANIIKQTKRISYPKTRFITINLLRTAGRYIDQSFSPSKRRLR